MAGLSSSNSNPGDGKSISGNYPGGSSPTTSPALLSAPTLSSPSNGVTGVSTTPTFTWSSVSGANRYWLMVATSPSIFPTDPAATSCPSCVISGNTDALGYTTPNSFPYGYHTAALSAGTVYYWKVQAWNTNGTQGNYSGTFSFTTASASTAPAMPTNPSPGSTTSPGPTTGSSSVPLSWSASSRATYYGLGVRDLATNVLVVDINVSGTSYTANLSAGRQYRWNVNACNAAGCSSYTTPLYFQTPAAVSVPLMPANLSPGSTSSPGPTTSSSSVTLSWGTSSGAAYYGLAVRDLATNVLVVDATVTGTPYTANLSANKQYRWNVNACNSAGCSNFTTPLYFQTPATAPGSFTLSNNAPICDTNPPLGPAVRLNWTQSSGATSYDLYRNGSLYFSGVTGTTFYNNANLTAGQTYTYVARAISASGSTNSNTITVSIPSNICNANPIISVSPASGPQQTTTFITSGSGFTPNGQVRRFLIFPNTSAPQEIAGTTANSSGQFSLNFISNCSSSVGTYTEYFIDVATGRQSNNATETITASSGCNAPTISINPQTGAQLTTTFTITGSGFTPNGAVRELIVSPDGITREVTGTTANSQGQISRPSTTNCATAVGSYTIWMIDVATGKESTRAQEVVTASSGCSVTPTLQVSQQSGSLGTTFSYTGTGFTRNSTTTLSITRGDGQQGNGGKYNTDSSGNVSFVITSMANDPTGTWTMRLTDDSTTRQASVSVQYTSTQQTGTDVMYYTASSVDVTIPDNTQLAPGETKNKVWLVQNAGTNTWTNYRLVFVPGTVNGNQSVNLSSVSFITINANPSQWINTPNLPITAPTTSGTYYSYWQMQNSSGTSFGARIYVKLRVVQPQNKTLSYGSLSGQLGTGDSPQSKSGYNADPVNTATGNYNYESTDLRAPGRGLDFEFGRAYNSQDTTPGPLGTGWSHSFNIYLTDISTTTPSVHYSDGKVLAYLNQYGTNNYQSSYQGYYDQLVKNADNTWTLRKTDQRAYQFNAGGKLTAIQDHNGNRISLIYAGGNLSQITDAVGRTFNLTYSGTIITSVADPMGRTLRFGYDASSNLTSFRDANNNLNSYVYDTSTRLTKIVDGRGNNLLANTYDGSSRVATQTNGRGNLWTFVYNADGSTSVFDPNNPVSNPNSKPIKYTQDTNFNIQRTTDRLSNQTDVRYDDRNNRSQVSDLQNNYTSYQYDANGNITAHTDPLQNTRQALYDTKNNPTQVTDELGTETQISYDANGNLTGVTDALNNVSTTTYDTFGQPLTTTDANGNTTTRTYDSQGNLVSIKDTLNNTTTYAYDAVGRRTSMTDARGKTTTYTYDANDNLLAVSDPSGNVTTYTYDANNNRTSMRDARGNTTAYEYDQNNLLVKETDQVGNFVQHTYDALDRRISTRDKRGNITTFGYDSEGRLIAVTDPLGHKNTYTYDANGNRTQVIDARNQATKFTYDALNRVTKIQDPLGNIISKEYDAAGRVTREVGPRGNATQFTYDAVSNLSQVLDAAGGTAKYAYDKNRNRISQTDPNNNTSRLAYDKLNRLASTQDPLNNTYSYTYDVVGNRISQTDAKGRIINFAYDASNRLSTITYPDSTSVRFSYDASGNAIQMVDALGTSSYSYDQLNRLTSYTDALGKTIGYQYDPNGNIATLTYPDGKQVTYQYDAANRLISLTDWAGKTTSYQYDNTNLVTMLSYPNGTTTTFIYDTFGRLTSKTDDPAISAYTFTLDANGNRTGASIRQPLATLLNNTSQSSSYDSANRIQTSGAATFTFDVNGNMTSKTENGTATSYAYDFNDRLTGVGGSTQYFYNGNGIRLRKVESSTVTGYVVDINNDLSQVLSETDSSGNITSYYVYGLGLAYKVMPSGNHYYYHYDAIGSTIAMTDDAKSIVNAYAYDPFGKVTNSFENTRNSFLFVGQYGVMQESNGLLFMRARYYAPDLGRFLNKDRVLGTETDSQSLNLFVYTDSNPVNRVDPGGLTWNPFPAIGKAVNKTIDQVNMKIHQWVDSVDKFISSLETEPGLCGPQGYPRLERLVPDEIKGVFNFREVCKHHDENYGKFGKRKADADLQLLVEALSSCKGQPSKVRCVASAFTYYSAVSNLGWLSYVGGQFDAIKKVLNTNSVGIEVAEPTIFGTNIKKGQSK
jgi:RHS repeat-associated protein